MTSRTGIKEVAAGMIFLQRVSRMDGRVLSMMVDG